MNLVDLLILFGFGLAILDGWKRGIVGLLLDLASLALAIGAAFVLYEPVGNWLGSFGLSEGLQPIAGFVLILFLADAVLRVVLGVIGRFIPSLLKGGLVGRAAGVGAGLVKQAVLTALLVNLLLFLPIIPAVRSSILASQLGPKFVSTTPVFERALAAIITPAIEQLQEFTTVTKIADSPIEIDVPVESLRIDRAAEQELFRLANEARAEAGLATLEWDEELADVGRVHSKDMWVRQFFAHVNPDGQDPFDRMDAAGVGYLSAGENLALAPTTPTAHQGLMDSPGHRANILDPSYGRLGIGAVRNGLYGVMYTQLFRN
ncbi:CvpA family protein [Candidatus Berkelbacteria bacterium]|nr:CvpA family protein [Candidatus Berkelbacteria bacterium]